MMNLAGHIWSENNSNFPSTPVIFFSYRLVLSTLKLTLQHFPSYTIDIFNSSEVHERVILQRRALHCQDRCIFKVFVLCLIPCFMP